VTDASVRVERVGRAALRRSLRRRSRKRWRRFLRFTISLDSETRIGAAVWAPGVDRATVHPPGYMDKAPHLACRMGPTPKVPAAADSCKKIRLSADAANPLNRSRNWRADGDGWRFAPDAGVVQRLKGLTVCKVGSELWRGSLSDRVLIAENRCTALFV